MGIESQLKKIDAATAGLHVLTDRELKKLQDTLKEMLQDIAEVCEKNKIAWSLSGGSVLGAVRHKGFIPWDDDIDLIMPREDYNRFRGIFPDCLSSKYVLKEPGDKAYIMHFPKICKKGTKAQDVQSANHSDDEISIEICIVENTYDNLFLHFLHGIECTAYLFIDSALRVEYCKENLLKYGSGNKQLQKEVNMRLFFAKFFHFRTLEEWLSRSDRCFSKSKNGKSKLVVIPGGGKHFWGEIFDREKLCQFKKAPFAGSEFYIMVNYDYYLNKRYGSDYMTVPKESAREKHAFIELDFGDSSNDAAGC